jgi:hypothetical protein
MGRRASVAVPAFAPWVRTDWRHRRGALIALVLLVGIAAGGVMAVVGGARRTATSLERLAAASRSSDVLVDVGGGGLPAAKRIARFRSVEHSAPTTVVFGLVDGVDADIGLFLPRDDTLGKVLERDILVRGHRPDPGRSDEVTINEPMAKLGRLEVGDTLDIRTLSPAQVKAEQYDRPLGPVLPVTVTGITRGPADLVDRPEGNIFATPALYPEVAGKVDEFALYVAVRLRSGATVADLKRELSAIAPSDDAFDLLSFADQTRPARRTISTLAIGLAVLAAVAAAAVLVTIAQSVGRHVGGAVPHQTVMEALGMVRRQREWALAATVLPAVVLAPVLAVSVAIAASPLAPIGLARHAEPTLGLRLDAPVLLVGALATGLVVVIVGAVAAILATHPPRVRAHGRPSSAALAAARVGMPPPAVHGVSLAFDTRPVGRPVRPTLIALVVAVLLAAASITFTASLLRLADSSDRWGSPWDLSLDFTSKEVARATQQLARDDGLDAVSRWDSGAAIVDGDYVRASAVAHIRGDLGFSLVDGRQPLSGEVVVGPETAARNGLEIGDEVTVAPPDDPRKEARLRVVGIALFPEIDDGDFVDGIGLTSEEFAAHAAVPDLFEASQVVVTVAPDASVGATEDRLRGHFGRSVDSPRPVRPGAVANLVDIGAIPRLLLVFAALLGLAALAHTLRSTAARRADDFTTMRAVGMTRRQRWGCSLSQSIALAAAALLVGVPLGIAAGRAAWSSVARSIDVAPEPVSPAVALAAVVAGTVVVAIVASLTVRQGRRQRAWRG